MGFDVVNIGAAPNDGTGDTLRAAMGKINDNTAKIPGKRAAFDPNSPLHPAPIVGDYDLQPLLVTDGTAQIYHWDATGGFWV